MEINRHNYEMFFLLYADHELDRAAKEAVEAFVAVHADLREELNVLLQTRLTADEPVAFPHKERLYKTSAAPSLINMHNYEEYFVLYADGELNAEAQRAVEDFIGKYPQKQAELALLQSVKLEPDSSIVFPGKASLYRAGKSKPRIVAMQWSRIVAAASIVAIGLWVWMNTDKTMPRTADQQPVTAGEQLTLPVPLQETTEATKPLVVQHEASGPAAGTAKEEIAGKNHTAEAASPEVYNSNSAPAEYTIFATYAETEIHKTPALVDPAPVLPAEVAALAAETSAALIANGEIHNKVQAPGQVKPLILDQAAFQGESDQKQYEAITKNEAGIAYLDTDHPEKKSKGTFRGLLRRASRLVDHITNPDTDNERSVVRVAGFEIARK
jgi:hypothetical protein